MTKLDIVEITIDDIKFKIQEFNWKTSINIQKKVMQILSPVLNVLALKSDKDEDGDEEKTLLDKIEIKDLGSAIKNCLLSIEDPFSLFKEMFSNTYVVIVNQSGAEGEKPLNTDEALNEVFHKKTMTAFKLVIEVLKVNELSFSSGSGGVGDIIGSLMNSMQK